MWFCALAMFCYGPLESAMAAWTTKYLGEKDVSESDASNLLSGFWLAFMASRLATAFGSSLIESNLRLVARIESLTILALSLLCIVVLCGVVWSHGRSLAVALVIAAGFVFGPIFPAIMATLLRSFEASLHGRAVGLLFAIGGIGWTCIPIVIGVHARRTSVQRGFLIAIFSAVGLLAVACGMIGYEVFSKQVPAAPNFPRKDSAVTETVEIGILESQTNSLAFVT